MGRDYENYEGDRNDRRNNVYEGFERRRRQHRGGPPWAQWGDWEQGRGRRGGPGGPPPWVAELLGFGQADRGRGPRARRGDVRSAILDVLRTAEESPNGYQVIQAITARSGGAWKPSPGSVYPTIQQLEDEGLVESDDAHGRRALRLTDAGVTYCDENAVELESVWLPFERERSNPWTGADSDSHADVRAEIPQVLSAIWQIATTGSPAQRDAAVEILTDARRRLYGVLADGPEKNTD